MKLRLLCSALLFAVQVFSRFPAFSRTFSTCPITSGAISTTTYTIDCLAEAAP